MQWPPLRAIRDDEFELAELWRQLLAGHVFVTATYCEEGRCFAELEQRSPSRARPTFAQSILERAFIGESQKGLAAELDVSLPTVAMHCASGLRTMVHGYLVSRAPILLVMAAQAAQGLPLEPARVVASVNPGRLLISVELPGAAFAERLAPSELEVVEAMIVGKTHAEIASARSTSVRTTANQLASAFHKLRLSGRTELRVRAIVELSAAYLGRSSFSAKPTRLALGRPTASPGDALARAVS